MSSFEYPKNSSDSYSAEKQCMKLQIIQTEGRAGKIHRIYQILEKTSDLAISYYKLGTANYIITKWNSFDINVQINFEEEDKGTFSF